MSRAPKRARMSVGGCNPPRYVYEPMEQDEELSVYQDKQVVYPVEPPSPMPSPTPEPEEKEPKFGRYGAPARKRSQEVAKGE